MELFDTQEWNEVNDKVNELVSNSTAKVNTSDLMRNRSQQLLKKIESLLNETKEHQNELNS